MQLFQRFFQKQFVRRRRPARSSYKSFENLEPRLAFDVDLSVAIHSGQNTYVPGSDKVDTIIVQNLGSEAVTNARVVVPLPEDVLSASWTGQGSPGSTVLLNGSSTNDDSINTFVSLPAGGAAIFTVTNQIADDAIGQLRTEVTAVTPLGVEDSDPDNNRAFDINVRPYLAVGSDMVYQGTPTVSLVDPLSGDLINQFHVYETQFAGGVRTAIADMNGDGVDDIVVAPGEGRVAEVRVFDVSGTEMSEYRLRPFGPSFLGGVNIALGDVDGDGVNDLIAAQSRGSTVATYRGDLEGGWEASPFRSYKPYGSTHLAGVNVAVADIGEITNGTINQMDSKDGRSELVIGTGAGAIKPVQIVDVSGSPTVVVELVPDSVLDSSGVQLSTGLYDDDSVDDIFVSSGRGVNARTDVYQAFRQDGLSLVNTKKSLTTGKVSNAVYRVAPLDNDGDGHVDALFALGAGGAEMLDADGNVTNTVSVIRGRLTPATQVSAPPSPNVIKTSSGLRYEDLVVGLGTPVGPGQEVSVHYVGSQPNGDVFDSSLTSGTPFTFTLGQGTVIQGWDEGVAGMREGGRRRLIIPADMAYGENPGGGRPGGTLVFDVQLLSASNPGLGGRPPIIRDPLLPN